VRYSSLSTGRSTTDGTTRELRRHSEHPDPWPGQFDRDARKCEAETARSVDMSLLGEVDGKLFRAREQAD